MTAQELIECLKQFPPDMKVYYSTDASPIEVGFVCNVPTIGMKGIKDKEIILLDV